MLHWSLRTYHARHSGRRIGIPDSGRVHARRPDHISANPISRLPPLSCQLAFLSWNEWRSPPAWTLRPIAAIPRPHLPGAVIAQRLRLAPHIHPETCLFIVVMGGDLKRMLGRRNSSEAAAQPPPVNGLPETAKLMGRPGSDSLEDNPWCDSILV